MTSRDFSVKDADAGKRLDLFLSGQLPEVSRNVISSLITENHALVNGKPAKKGLKLRSGDHVDFTLPEPARSELLPERMPLAILHEDDDLVIVDKPAGLCVHPAPGHQSGTLLNGLLYRYPKIAYVGSVKRPGIVHRLDLNTSGAMVAALSPTAFKGLTTIIKKRKFQREYLAVVRGVPVKKTATINMALARDPAFRRRFAVSRLAGLGKPAITHYEVQECYEKASLLRITLETGRTHQIRVHMQKIGHSVCGDEVYGGVHPDFPIARQALHAVSLAFKHPLSGKEIAVKAPLPKDFTDLLDFLTRR